MIAQSFQKPEPSDSQLQPPTTLELDDPRQPIGEQLDATDEADAQKVSEHRPEATNNT